MLGVILTGHGGFATGLSQAVTQIIGKQPQFCAVDFPDGATTEQLEQELRKAIADCDTGEGAVFLTDILGGSPFKTAAMLSFEQSNIEVISGTNLQLLIEMLLARDDFNVVSFRDAALNSARSGITSLWHENQKKVNAQNSFSEEDDGI